MARKPAAPAIEDKPAPKPTARLTVSGDSPMSARPAGPAPAVWGRCGACRLVHAPGACRLTAAVPGLLKGPSASATVKAPQGPAYIRERDAHCLPPQAPGLELPDDVLSLAQAAAGDGDLVEWVCEAIRMRATPRAATLSDRPTVSDRQAKRVRPAVSDRPTGEAERSRRRREAKAGDQAAKAAEAARKRAAREAKRAEAKGAGDA